MAEGEPCQRWHGVSGAGGRCPVCGNADFRFAFHEIDHDFERCLACDFTRMKDPKSPADLDAYYLEERAQGEGAWQEHKQNLERFDTLLSQIEKRCRPGRFLDVGCSLGTSLVAARARGWEVTGTELCRPVAEFGRKEWDLDIRLCHLEDAGFAEASFDLVFMHHTLEHVREPDRVLELCRRLLRPGGILYEALPNHGCLKSRLLGPFWGWGVTPEHLSLFTSRTLQLIVRRAGFVVLEQWTRSYREDPRLILDVMRRLGRVETLRRWCGMADGVFDQEAYIGLLRDHRFAHWVSNRMWPARLVQMCGLGEEAHLVAMRQ